MNVLIINSVYGIRSTGRIVKDLRNHIIKQKDECVIAYGRIFQSDEENVFRIGSNLSIIRHMALTAVLDRHGFGSERETKKLIESIESVKPDIIHLHNIHGYYLNIQELFEYIKNKEIPVVWTLHDCWSFTGHCAHFEYAQCDKWKTQCHHCPQKDQYPISLLADNSYNNYNSKKEIFTRVDNLMLVTPSVWLKDKVKESFLKEYPIRVINNGIDLEVFKTDINNFVEKSIPDEKFVILGVASPWTSRKGLEYFHQLSQFLDVDDVIILIGLSKKQIQNLPKGIIGIEATHDIEELASYYRRADVFMNPTLEDTFPTTNLEALACGTPVITFNSGGSGEAINENNGIVLKDKSVEALLDAKNQVKKLGKEFYRNRCSASAQQYAKQIAYAKYYELYKDVISTSSKHSD